MFNVEKTPICWIWTNNTTQLYSIMSHENFIEILHSKIWWFSKKPLQTLYCYENNTEMKNNLFFLWAWLYFFKLNIIELICLFFINFIIPYTNFRWHKVYDYNSYFFFSSSRKLKNLIICVTVYNVFKINLVINNSKFKNCKN